MLNDSEDWKSLRAILRREAENMLHQQKSVNPARLIESLLERDRGTVIRGLAAMVEEEMEARNDEHATQSVLKAHPELRPYLKEIEVLSETLTCDRPTSQRCYAAAELIYRLREAECRVRAEMIKHERDRLTPIFDAHPGITVREARKLLADETERTLSGLNPGLLQEGDQPC